MIILSGVLVVVAIALLVTGIITGNTGHQVLGLDGLKLIYVSIGVSIVSALCLAIGVFVRRKELFGTAGSAERAKKTAATGRTGKTARPAKAKARVGAGEETAVLTPASATDVPAETTVYVVPGRKRYHLESCRQLAGRDKEELTFEEAREEGFTACTACLPDTALAARAALTDIANASDSAETREEAVPAQDVTRVDLPVTRTEPPKPRRATVAEPGAETTDLSRAAETVAPAAPEPEPEPVAERPAVRSRSLFEPLSRSEQAPEPEDATAADDEAATAPETRSATIEPEAPPATAETQDADPAEPEATTAADPQPANARPADAQAADHQPADAQAANARPADTQDTAADAQDTEEPEPADEPSDVTLPADDAEDAESGPEPEESVDTASAERAAAPEKASEPEEASGAASAEAAEAAPERANPAGTGQADDHEDANAGHAPEDDAEHTALPFVRILSGTKRYHRPDCALIEDIADDADDLESLPPQEAKDRGCTPCLVCQPDKAAGSF